MLFLPARQSRKRLRLFRVIPARTPTNQVRPIARSKTILTADVAVIDCASAPARLTADSQSDVRRTWPAVPILGEACISVLPLVVFSDQSARFETCHVQTLALNIIHLKALWRVFHCDNILEEDRDWCTGGILHNVIVTITTHSSLRSRSVIYILD